VRFAQKIPVSLTGWDFSPGACALANSTCKRTLGANGSLTEIVELDGSGEHLTDEDLEKFIASFPIETS
jgi:hypothetical protein